MKYFNEHGVEVPLEDAVQTALRHRIRNSGYDNEDRHAIDCLETEVGNLREAVAVLVAALAQGGQIDAGTVLELVGCKGTVIL